MPATGGYRDGQILETVLMVGLANFSNSVASGLGTAPDLDPPKVAPRGAQAAASVWQTA